MRTEIKSRQEFDAFLGKALGQLRLLVHDEQNDRTLVAILRQLEAIEQWTIGGRNMTKEHKDRIVMGLQAHREMSDFPIEQDLVLAINNYIETQMPTAKSRIP